MNPVTQASSLLPFYPTQYEIDDDLIELAGVGRAAEATASFNEEPQTVSRRVTSLRQVAPHYGCGNVTFDNPLMSKICRLTSLSNTHRITLVIAAVTYF